MTALVPDLRQAVLDALDFAEQVHRDEVERLEELLRAERMQHRLALSDAVTALRAQLDEARRHVEYLTAELLRIGLVGRFTLRRRLVARFTVTVVSRHPASSTSAVISASVRSRRLTGRDTAP